VEVGKDIESGKSRGIDIIWQIKNKFGKLLKS